MKVKQPLRMPADPNKIRRFYFWQTASGFELQDQHWVSRIAGWMLTLPLVGAATLSFTAAVSTLLGPVFSTPRGPASPQQSTADVLGVVVIGLILALIPLGLWWYLMSRFGLHRRSVVRIDNSRRSCRCHNKLMGWTVGRREVDLMHAEWEPRAGSMGVAVPRSQSAMSGLATILLLFAGPIGWLISLLQELGRGSSKRPIDLSQIEVVRLELSDADGAQALLTLGDEDVAQTFLEAWDRLQR